MCCFPIIISKLCTAFSSEMRTYGQRGRQGPAVRFGQNVHQSREDGVILQLPCQWEQRSSRNCNSLPHLRLPNWNILISFLTWNYRDVYKKAVVNIINSTMEITAKTSKLSPMTIGANSCLLAIIKYARLFPFTHQSNFAHRSSTKKDDGVVQEAVSAWDTKVHSLSLIKKHCFFSISLNKALLLFHVFPLCLSPLEDDFMRRGREGHKNNELGKEEGTPEKKETR